MEKPPSIIRLQQSWLTTTLSFILIYMSNLEAILPKSDEDLITLEIYVEQGKTRNYKVL